MRKRGVREREGYKERGERNESVTMRKSVTVWFDRAVGILIASVTSVP